MWGGGGQASTVKNLIIQEFDFYLTFIFYKLQRERKQKKLYSEDWALGDEEIEGRRGFSLQEKLEDPKFVTHSLVKEMHGTELNVAYFQRYGFSTPLLFKEKTGLGLYVEFLLVGLLNGFLFRSSRADVELFDKRRADVRGVA